MNQPVYVYRAKLLRVIDGDTYELDVDLGMRVHTHQHIRLRDVNTPEKREAGWSEAVLFVTDAFQRARVILIQTFKDTQTFNRYVADVWLDGVSLAEMLVAAGLAVRV